MRSTASPDSRPFPTACPALGRLSLLASRSCALDRCNHWQDHPGAYGSVQTSLTVAWKFGSPYSEAKTNVLSGLTVAQALAPKCVCTRGSVYESGDEIGATGDQRPKFSEVQLFALGVQYYLTPQGDQLMGLNRNL